MKKNLIFAFIILGLIIVLVIFTLTKNSGNIEEQSDGKLLRQTACFYLLDKVE